MGRRSLLKKIWPILGSLAAIELLWVGGSIFKSKQEQKSGNLEQQVLAGKVEDFNTSSITAIPQGQFYLARLENGGFLALSPICTHLGCSINWNDDKNIFVCPCHGSTFSMEGEVLTSPATRPLDIFPIKIEDGHILVDTFLRKRRSSYQPSQVTMV